MNSVFGVAKDSLTQLFVVLTLGFVIFTITKIFKSKKTLAEFMGLTSPRNQFDQKFVLIVLGLSLFAVVTTLLQFSMSETMRGFLFSETSPYGKILKGSGLSLASILSGLIYCFVSAGGSEEVLFRALIAKNLFSWLGNFYGNLVQALIFWVMHLLIFRFVTGDWFSWIQAFGFFVSFGLGLIFGFLNFRKGGGSIWPSWIAHGVVNFSTFLTLFFLFEA